MLADAGFPNGEGFPKLDLWLRAPSAIDSAMAGAAEERTNLFQQAERVLVEDVPAVFVYYRTPVQFIKPYVKGDALEPDVNGIKALHWPNYTTMSTVPEGIYIGNEAPSNRS